MLNLHWMVARSQTLRVGPDDVRIRWDVKRVSTEPPRMGVEIESDEPWIVGPGSHNGHCYPRARRPPGSGSSRP